MTDEKRYSFKISARVYLLVGAIYFFVFGYCTLIVDYGDSEMSIKVGRAVMLSLTLLPSILLIWYGVAKRVFVYSDRLIFRNMLFQSELLFFSEMAYYEHKVTQNTIYLCSLEKRKKKIGFASIKDLHRLREVLAAHRIQEIADFRRSSTTEQNSEILYTKLDVIVSAFDKKKWRWMSIFFVFMLSCPVFLYIYEEIQLVTAIMLFVVFIFAIIMFEVSLAKEKLVLHKDYVCRYYSFKRSKIIRYEEIDYVRLYYTTNEDGMERSYIFYFEGREFFRIPANFTNINQVIDRLVRYGITIVLPDRVHIF